MPLVYKATSTSRTSTVSAAADPDLQVSMLAGKQYLVEGVIHAQAGATPDMVARFRYTGTLTDCNGFWQAKVQGSINQATGFGVNRSIAPALLVSPSSEPIDGASTGTIVIFIRCEVEPSSDGTFQFEWAQRLSSATATTVLAGSFFYWQEITAT